MSVRARSLSWLAVVVGLATVPLLAGCGATVAYTQPYSGYGPYGETGYGPYSDDTGYLSAYGTWITVPGYGLVWQPYASLNWSPYSSGQWVFGVDGWVWVSSEPFGWLVDHYGDWDYLPSVGWFWVRGSRWAAAPGIYWSHVPQRERERLRERIPGHEFVRRGSRFPRGSYAARMPRFEPRRGEHGQYVPRGEFRGPRQQEQARRMRPEEQRQGRSEPGPRFERGERSQGGHAERGRSQAGHAEHGRAQGRRGGHR